LHRDDSWTEGSDPDVLSNASTVMLRIEAQAGVETLAFHEIEVGS
jgi:hypothetical protein